MQVGSALGERSIPLQSAYCGAKHAINGFTSSLRCELLDENSSVHVTVVQMPGVNTRSSPGCGPGCRSIPSRCRRSTSPRLPPAPSCSPPTIPAGDSTGSGTTAATIVANRLAPALLDRYLARTGYRAQQTAQPAEPGRPDNLLQPVDGVNGRDHGSHGAFDDRSHDRSLQLWISQHARMSSGLLAGAAVIGAFLAGRLGHRQ